METSSPAVGSSATISRGTTDRARATAARRAWPPLSAWGKRDKNRSESPACCARPAISSRRAEPIPAMRLGSAIMAPIRWRGLNELNGSWKRREVWLRMARKLRWEKSGSGVPSRRISPPDGFTSPSSARPKVVLPEPLSPTMQTISPGRMASDTPARMASGRALAKAKRPAGTSTESARASIRAGLMMRSCGSGRDGQDRRAALARGPRRCDSAPRHGDSARQNRSPGRPDAALRRQSPADGRCREG